MTLLHEDDKELFAAALNRARTATEPMHFEARLTDQSMYFQWSLLWSKVEQSYFCVAHDISKRKDLERMRKEFVAVISHDLRSPITTISGTTKLLLHEAFGPIPDESRKVLDQIMLQCSQIIELVNDLLDLEKFEAKQMQLTQESIAIHQEILHEYGNRASTEISSSLPEAYSLTVDKARFLLALKGILEEVEALQSAHILLQLDENKTIKEFTLTINCSACQNLAALASILAKLSGKIGNIAEEETVASSSRLKLPLAMRIIEAHNGKITATINENNLVLEIKLPAAQPVLDLEMPARKV